tara:strand:+ start:187 stop:564 length:378 start_codon:yes stop_codon:yes gene_type:complete
VPVTGKYSGRRNDSTSREKNGPAPSKRVEFDDSKISSRSNPASAAKSQPSSLSRQKKPFAPDSADVKDTLSLLGSSKREQSSLENGIPGINLANNINSATNILPKFEPLPVLVGLVGLGVLLTMK